MNIILKAKRWIAHMNQEDIDRYGEPKDMLCQKCKGPLDIPAYYCGETYQFFCWHCELGTPEEGSAEMINTCRLQSRKKEHVHLCIKEFKVKRSIKEIIKSLFCI